MVARVRTATLRCIENSWALSVVAFLALGFASSRAEAASFSCAGATHPQEKLVCGDADLSKLDENMAQAYASAIAGLAPPDTAILKTSQRAWLKQLRGIR